MADEFVAGVAEHPMDGPSNFCQELSLMAGESDGEWARIKQTVFDILLHRDLVGKLPLTIHELATKSAMAEQLEAIHSTTFFPLKPSSYRRELVHRIFAYEMTRLRGNVRHRGGGGGGADPQEVMPLKPETPSEQATPELSARESPVAEPSAAESLAVEPHTVESLAAGPHSIEVLEEMDLDQAAVPDPSAIGPRAPGLLIIEHLPAQMMRGTPARVLAPIPVFYWSKEVIVTAVVPSDPGFRVEFTKCHLLQGSGLSIARLFEILGEEGFQGSPGAYVVVDEFDDRLASQRHLEVAFQLLANREKLATTWRVLKKAEYEEQFPKAGLMNSPAPLATMSNVSGSPKAGFLGDVPFSESDIGRPAYPRNGPVLPESSPKEDSEMQDRAPPPTTPGAHLPKTGFFGDSPFSELDVAEPAYRSNGPVVPEMSPKGDSEMQDRDHPATTSDACWPSEIGLLGDGPFSKSDAARPEYPSNGPAVPESSPKEDSEMQDRSSPATTTDARWPEKGFLGDGPLAELEIAGPAYPNNGPVLPESPPKGDCEMQDQADGVEEPQLPKLPKVKKKAFLDISDWDSDDSN